ncbi:CGNR zinc finger domain-containing protein [Streptomyces sp. NPDC048606]|uniref:CGNR zinc finger domain-containing protein n=1 Tax=Streptomyces sp. NPDC048606 TaxID=3154726 RepID=UPI00341E17F5
MFDSHVAVLLDHAVALVNALTDGEARGRDYLAPRGPERVAAVDAAVPHTGTAALARAIDTEQADRLAVTARSMREVFRAVQEGRVDAAAEVVNDLLRDTAARPRLDRAGGEDWNLHFHGPDDSFAAGVGAGCATALALAVGGGLASRLGVCQAHRCDRVYVDNSRNAARQFCSTACQNRTKAATFRARRNAAG